MRRPRFSIIIPAHNAEDRIHKALNMIYKQTFKDYQLIVICDSCEDATEDISRSYGAEAYAVEYHNDGLSRNKGLEEAQGEWILFLDDDDWWLHEFVLESLDHKIKQLSPEVDIIQFSFYWQHRGYTPPILKNNVILPNVWSKCWKREIIGDTRFPNIRAESDLHFTRAIMEKEPEIELWDNMFVYYNYLRPGSQTWELEKEEEA